MADLRPLDRAYSGSHRIKGARGEVALTGAWPWPIAQLLEIHDGDTVKLAIDHGFDEDAKKWIRLRDVWAPEVDDDGGPEATADCQGWFTEHAPRRLRPADDLPYLSTARDPVPAIIHPLHRDRDGIQRGRAQQLPDRQGLCRTRRNTMRDWKRYRKFLVAVATAIAVTVQAAISDGVITENEWVKIALTALGAALVYLIRNDQPVTTRTDLADRTRRIREQDDQTF